MMQGGRENKMDPRSVKMMKGEVQFDLWDEEKVGVKDAF